MGLIVVIMVNVFFQALDFDAGGIGLVKLFEPDNFGKVFGARPQVFREFCMKPPGAVTCLLFQLRHSDEAPGV